MGGTAAFAIASLLSISNPIGWVVLGTALGAGAILSREARQMRNQDADAGRLELERLLSRYIHECASQLRSGLDAAWTQVEETLESGMDYALRSERERLDGSAAALADARQRAGEAAVVRAAALRGPLEQLNAIREDVVRRGEEVSRQLRPGPADAAT